MQRTKARKSEQRRKESENPASLCRICEPGDALPALLCPTLAQLVLLRWYGLLTRNAVSCNYFRVVFRFFSDDCPDLSEDFPDPPPCFPDKFKGVAKE